MSSQETIAANVRDARNALSMSQESLADTMRAAGMAQWSQATVWSVETCKRQINIDDLSALVQILGPAILDGTPLARPADIRSVMILDSVESALAEARREIAATREWVEGNTP